MFQVNLIASYIPANVFYFHTHSEFCFCIGYIRGAYKEDMSRAMKLVLEQKKKKWQFSMLAIKKLIGILRKCSPTFLF